MSYMEEQAKYQRDKPLADAAEEVRATAAKAREMLTQFQQSRIWRFLIIKPAQ